MIYPPNPTQQWSPWKCQPRICVCSLVGKMKQILPNQPITRAVISSCSKLGFAEDAWKEYNNIIQQRVVVFTVMNSMGWNPFPKLHQLNKSKEL